MKKLFTFLLLAAFLYIPQIAGATSVSPAIIDIQLDPGQSTTYEIKLYNETKEDVFINGSIEKFIPKGERGEAQVVPFDIADKAVNWLKLPNNSIVLKPGEEISVPVIVEVPTTADVGGYYLAVMWESSSGPKTEKSHQTLISSRIGVLMLLEVKGDFNRNLEIVDFNLVENKKFYSNSALDFFLKLRNTGSVHLRPEGSIIIKDFLGRTTDVLSVNFEKGAILPNTTRVFSIGWKNQDDKLNIISGFTNQFTNFAFGRFSAKAIIDYDTDKTLESNNIYFWIIPWPLILIILFVLIIIFLIARKIKNKKKNI